MCSHLPPTRERLIEINTVLYNNINNKFIAKICLFVEDINLQNSSWPEAEQTRKLWTNPKIEVIRTFKRQTYQELFDFANHNITGITMISNCDIYYDNTLEKLNQVDFSKFAVCLSKIEIIDKFGKLFRLTPEMCGFSQDTWIFKTPIKKMKNANFHMGVQRCDNRISFEFKEIGLMPINPANDINSYHWHLSAVRTYRKDIDCVPGHVWMLRPPYDLTAKPELIPEKYDA